MNHANVYDVIVIGSGVAGLSAAIEASKHYRRVAVIDKLPKAGGNTLISDGGIVGVGSDLQRDRGIEDSIELLTRDMLKAGEYKNHEPLVRLVASESKRAYEWLKTQGVKFLNRVDIFGGHSVARGLTPVNKKGKDIIDALTMCAQEAGVDFYFRQSLSKLHMKARKVVAVDIAATQSSSVKTLHVKGRVVIATGGFGHDQEMIMKYAPQLQHLMSTNLPSAQGETLRMLDALDALLIDMEAIQCGPWASPDEKGFGHAPLFGDYIVLPRGIVIDPGSAKRIVNEHGDRKIVSDAMLDLPFALGIADHRMVEESGWDLSTLLKKDVVRTFDSLANLAGGYGINVSNLVSTIDEYNQKVSQKGTDAFGKQLGHLSTIQTPPFYAMRMVPKIHHTMGGVAINAKAQVLEKNGVPFTNLYAAGECTGGIHGASRLGSMAITEGVVMGRIAGGYKPPNTH